MKKLILSAVAATAYTGLCAVIAKKVKEHIRVMEETAKTPENRELVGYKNIDGHFITFEECDHIRGETLNACATGDDRVIVTRTIKNSRYYKAVLDHEIGHIVAAERFSFVSSQLDLYRIELQADKYSVEQGNLDELFEFRLNMLLKYWYVPVTYNTTNLVYLSVLKAKKAFFK